MTKTFVLHAEVTVSCWTEVEADTLEEAVEISKERTVDISRSHGGHEATEQWIIDEGDGEPKNITVSA